LRPPCSGFRLKRFCWEGIQDDCDCGSFH
jgi:hypothetical protein